MAWLPTGFRHPGRLDLPSGHHLRPIRGSDVDLDHPAVMGSQERLWRMYGEAWGWPLATMTTEEDRVDLERHEAEMDDGRSFNYAIFDASETELLGCVYIDPPPAAGTADAVVSWWVVDHAAGGRLEADLAELIPRWLAESWPFTAIRYGT